MSPRACAALIAVTFLSCAERRPAADDRIPILFDTDIGTDIDDAFALGLILASPELDLRGVTTVSADAYARAMVACRFLEAAGRSDIPVAAGRPRRTKRDVSGQHRWGWEEEKFAKRPERERAVDFLYNQLKARPGELTILAVGDLTNVGRLVSERPECKPWIKRIVIMGGFIPPPARWEWNIRSDVPNARKAFSAGLPPIVMATGNAMKGMGIDAPRRKRIFEAKTPWAESLHALWSLWKGVTPTRNETPHIADLMATMLCVDEGLYDIKDLHVEIDGEGVTHAVDGPVNARATMGVRKDEALEWMIRRLAQDGGGSPPPRRPPLKVLVWDEQQEEQKKAYPDYLGNQIAGYLRKQDGLEVRSAGFKDPEQGLSDADVEWADAVLWWGHVRHKEVNDKPVGRIVKRVLEGKCGLVAIHSAHFSKPFRALMVERFKQDVIAKLPAGVDRSQVEFVMGQEGKPEVLKQETRDGKTVVTIAPPRCMVGAWRHDGAPSHVEVLAPDHPIAKGLPAKFDVPQTEMYDEPFTVPEPDTVVFFETWDKGEKFRAGCCWNVGEGRVFYFRPGHETYPVFMQEETLRIVFNAALWTGRRT